MPVKTPHLLLTLAVLLLGSAAKADDEYQVQLPDTTIYRAMLDANKTSGWVTFRNYAGRQLVYFTALQSMHCRLSEIRYSINSTDLDKTFPLGKCDPQLPFNLPDGEDYIYMGFAPGTVKTIAVQAVWDDGAGSEVVVYKPCDNVGESTCVRIETILKPDAVQSAPDVGTDAR